jgi:hypothetical protein
MYILHTIHDDSSDFLQVLVLAHGGYGVSLHENVTIGQEFNSLRVTRLSARATY